MSKIKNPAKGVIYAIITAFLWGFLAVFLKIASEKIPPITIVWFRFYIAFIGLFIYFLIKQPRQLSILLKANFNIILPSIFLTLNYIGFMLGIHLTTPNNAQIFIQSGPVLLAIAGFIIFKEKFTNSRLIGFILVIIGFYLFYSQQYMVYSVNGKNYSNGVFLILFGGTMWSFYAIFQKKLINTYSTGQLNLFNFGVPMLLLLPFVNFEIFQKVSIGYFVLLIFLGLNTLIAYTCLSLALKYAEANKVSVVITCNPIITFITMAILGYLEVSFILPEKMNFLTIIGAMLVISGAIIVVYKKILR